MRKNTLYVLGIMMIISIFGCDSKKPTKASQKSPPSVNWVFDDSETVSFYIQSYFRDYSSSGSSISKSQDKIACNKIYVVDNQKNIQLIVQEFELNLKNHLTKNGWDVSSIDRSREEYHDGSKHMGFCLNAESIASSYVIYVDVNIVSLSMGKKELRLYWKSLRSAERVHPEH